MFYNLRKLIIKIEKKFNITLYYFFPLRILLVVFENIFLKKSQSLDNLSNYFLNCEILHNKNLSIISAGVGEDISFEEILLNKFKIDKIILVDPTKESKKILSNNKKYNFENYALYTNNEELKIYYKKGNMNLSLENLFNTNSYFNIKCITLNEIVKKYSISKINILKLDIEGVADKVIIKALEDGLDIEQICFELERPLSLLKQYNYFSRYIKITNFLKEKNYELFNCSQLKLGLRSEILAIKRYE